MNDGVTEPMPLLHVVYLSDHSSSSNPETWQECTVGQVSPLRWLDIPLKREKIDGPTTVLTLLGIELDTFCSELRLLAASCY